MDYIVTIDHFLNHFWLQIVVCGLTWNEYKRISRSVFGKIHFEFYISIISIFLVPRTLTISLSGHQNHSNSPIWGFEGGLPKPVAKDLWDGVTWWQQRLRGHWEHWWLIPCILCGHKAALKILTKSPRSSDPLQLTNLEIWWRAANKDGYINCECLLKTCLLEATKRVNYDMLNDICQHAV